MYRSSVQYQPTGPDSWVIDADVIFPSCTVAEPL